MSYTLGQQVRLTTAVTDSLGAPIDTTMSLVVTRPDGTTLVSGVGLTIINDGVGAYSCNFTTDQPGTWLYVWTASGSAIGVDDGQFDVLSITRRIVSLADVKLHLNKNNTADDVEIQDFIDAAQAVIHHEVGDVVPTAHSEIVKPEASGRLILTHRPVISVTSIAATRAGVPVVIASTGYVLNDTAGIVELTAGVYPLVVGTGVYVTYLSGLTGPTPPNIRLACLELVAHLWRNSQMGRNRRVRGTGPEDEPAVALGFSLPNRVRELLGSRRAVMF